jgi:hypothetical protein
MKISKQKPIKNYAFPDNNLFKIQSSQIILRDNKYFKELLEDPDCRGLLIRQAMTEGNIVLEYPREQVASLVGHARSAQPEEKDYISDMILRFLKKVDCFPLITEHQGIDLAERCLFSTSFFWEHIKKREERYSAPSPEFYLIMGSKKYEALGKTDIARNTANWRNFLEKTFIKAA